jgi:DNA methylase
MNQLSFFDEARSAAYKGAQMAFDTGNVLPDIRSFNSFGSTTICETVAGIDYYVNEFWTAGQRQAHSLHEISYRACFKAQLPEFFISRLTKPGDVVLDPFMGRGTTPLQATLMQRQPVGNDINPLSTLLARPRLRAVDLQAIGQKLRTVDWSDGTIQRDDLLAFYHPRTLVKLEALRNWIGRHLVDGTDVADPVVDWIRMIALNRLSGHSPGFFSGRSMPPNQAVSIKAQEKINAKLGVTPPERDVAAVILKKSTSLLRDGAIPDGVSGQFITGPASHMAGLGDATVDLVVTSPPFLDIVQYADDNWLRCWFAGIDPNAIAIDMHRTEAAWTGMVADVLRELARVIKPNGHVAFEVGEVRRGKVLLEQLVWKAAEGLPFTRLGVIVNQQAFTKTANLWGVSNNVGGTNSNRIVLLRRNDDT